MTAYTPKSDREMQAEINRVLRNALVEYKELPSANVAALVLQKADPDFLIELGRSLAYLEFLRLIRSERLKLAKSLQMPLPGFEKLPLRIVGPTGSRIRLGEARIADLREFLKVLNRQHEDRRAADPRIGETKKLIKLVSRQARKHRGITVWEALGKG
jgi:hypothetical protein